MQQFNYQSGAPCALCGKSQPEKVQDLSFNRYQFSGKKEIITTTTYYGLPLHVRCSRNLNIGTGIEYAGAVVFALLVLAFLLSLIIKPLSSIVNNGQVTIPWVVTAGILFFIGYMIERFYANRVQSWIGRYGR